MTPLPKHTNENLNIRKKSILHTILYSVIVALIFVVYNLPSYTASIANKIIHSSQDNDYPLWKRLIVKGSLKFGAMSGDVRSQIGLAILSMSPGNPFFPYDRQKAQYWARQAANQESGIYAYKLMEKLKSTDDFNNDVKTIINEAKLGNAAAAYKLGVMYNVGYGVPADKKQAILWLQKAVDLGSAYAADNLGYLYQKGDGVEKDPAKSLKLYQIAADRGDYAAMYNMGLKYSHLDNPKNSLIQTDFFKAGQWYDKSLQITPNTCAANDLGILYATGKMNQEEAEAKKLFKISIVTLLGGIPEGEEIKIDPSIDRSNLIEVYVDYQYAQAVHATPSQTVTMASPEVMKMVKDLAEKVVKQCWQH